MDIALAGLILMAASSATANILGKCNFMVIFRLEKQFLNKTHVAFEVLIS